jgi:hypothetical protein
VIECDHHDSCYIYAVTDEICRRGKYCLLNTCYKCNKCLTFSSGESNILNMLHSNLNWIIYVPYTCTCILKRIRRLSCI